MAKSIPLEKKFEKAKKINDTAFDFSDSLQKDGDG